jgi:hypothetical protein
LAFQAFVFLAVRRRDDWKALGLIVVGDFEDGSAVAGLAQRGWLQIGQSVFAPLRECQSGGDLVRVDGSVALVGRRLA